MACNCGKPKPGQPLGRPKPGQAQTQSNGGGLSARTQSYSLEAPDGSTTKFTGSLIEAQARAARSGATIRF